MMNKRFFCSLIFCFLTWSVFAVKVSRTINKDTIPNLSSAIVTVSISQLSVNGIAKLVEQIPQGFSAALRSSGGGRVLTGKNGEFKVIWLTLANSTQVTVKYELTHHGLNSGGSNLADHQIEGYFSYVHDDMKSEASIASTKIHVTGLNLPKVSIQKEEVVAAISQREALMAAKKATQTKQNKRAKQNTAADLLMKQQEKDKIEKNKQENRQATQQEKVSPSVDPMAAAKATSQPHTQVKPIIKPIVKVNQKHNQNHNQNHNQKQKQKQSYSQSCQQCQNQHQEERLT